MKNHILIPLMSVALLAGGCSDTWDDHYEPGAGTAGNLPVMDLLKSDPDLTRFAEMAEAAGYADLLSSTQTFTVWAPVNGALADVDLSDKDAVARTVANHVARFNISTASPAAEGVKMLNGKLLYFSDDATEFGGVRMLSSDNVSSNGVLHKIEAKIPYSYNFREYIDTHAETSEIAAFIARFDKMLLPSQIPGADASSDKSTEPVAFNSLLEYPVYGLGSIACEDSVFAMAVPDNGAWRKAYQEIKPYFLTYHEDRAMADSIQDVQTSLAIVSNLVFRMHGNPLAADSIMSTTGSVIKNPAAYFSGMTHIGASNGNMFLAGTLNYDMTETFCKPICLEAEEQSGRTTGAGTSVYTRSVGTDSEYADEISGLRYLEVTPTSSSRQPGVTFSVPDVLAGAYDIYASFVPATAADATNVNDSTRVQFTVNYMGINGRSQNQTFKNSDFVTSGSKTTLIKVAENFSFPTANYYDRVWSMDPTHDPNTRNVTTTIYVSTNVSNAEFNRNVFTRRFRIDRIYLVPVKPE